MPPKKLDDKFIQPGFQEDTAGMGMQWGQDVARLFFDPALQVRYAQQFSKGWLELWEGYLEGLTQGPEAIERYDVFLSH